MLTPPGTRRPRRHSPRHTGDPSPPAKRSSGRLPRAPHAARSPAAALPPRHFPPRPGGAGKRAGQRCASRSPARAPPAAAARAAARWSRTPDRSPSPPAEPARPRPRRGPRRCRRRRRAAPPPSTSRRRLPGRPPAGPRREARSSGRCSRAALEPAELVADRSLRRAPRGPGRQKYQPGPAPPVTGSPRPDLGAEPTRGAGPTRA